MENRDRYSGTHYLVEDYDPHVDYTNGQVVALTPEACYGLQKADVSYRIIEYFYSEDNMRKDEDKYFLEQLEWFKEFDSFFKNNVEYCRKHGINLSRAHFYRLKYFVDTIAIQAQIFKEFIRQARPDKVVYIGAKRENGSHCSIYDLYNNRRSFLLKLMSLNCRKENIPFSVQFSRETTKPKEPKQAPRTIKKFLKRLNAKSIYYFFKYNKAKCFMPKRAPRRLNLLILQAGCASIDQVVKNAMESKDKVFFKDEGKIVLVSDIIHKDVLNLSDFSDKEKADIDEEFKEAFIRFVDEKKLIGWINNKCDLDVTEMIIPYFKNFIEDICPRNILEISRFQEFYKDHGIDFVIARSSSEEDSISAFLAADKLGNRVCLQHGITFDTKIASLTELDLSDYYFTMDDISLRYFKNCLGLDYISECRVFESSHYLQSISRRWKNHRRPDDVIMYAPTRVFTGLRVFNNNFYSLPWYFELQRSIIDYFGAIKNKELIYKCTVAQEWLDRSMLLYVKDRNYANIHVEKTPLSQCLGKAERVIFDYPSTGFYEAAVSGIPAMSLFHETFELDNGVRTFFGKSLQGFSTIPEAIDRIAHFINAPSGDFMVNVPLSDANALDILRRVVN